MKRSRVQVTVRFFGPVAEAVGRSELVVRLPDRATVADALSAARREIPALEVPMKGPFRVAVGTEYADEERSLSDQDEVCLIPPVGGG